MRIALTPFFWGVAFTILAASCNTVAEPRERPLAEIENERAPLTESDCLVGEYFDRGTESCEPLEGVSEPIEAFGDLPLDVPPEEPKN
jgi:hypothetical protein